MLVLLSSAHSPRYREDILRCLAAPIGAIIQFRYDKRWIADSLLEKMEASLSKVSDSGAVCYVELDGSGPLTMIPVRAVEVLRVNIHGTTISIALRMKEFHFADPGTFTAELFALSGNLSPQKIDRETRGKYLFEIHNYPGSLKTGRTIGEWEHVVGLLSGQPAFQEEPFFWTVVGLELDGTQVDSNVFSELPARAVSEPFNLLIYHYKPEARPHINSTLSLSSGRFLERFGPSEVDIDSRYDLKRLRFEPKSAEYSPRETWIRVRTADRWNLDLSLAVKARFARTLGKAVFAGALFAIGPIIGFLTQTALPVAAQIAISLVMLISGVLGAATIFFSIKKIM